MSSQLDQVKSVRVNQNTGLGWLGRHDQDMVAGTGTQVRHQMGDDNRQWKIAMEARQGSLSNMIAKGQRGEGDASSAQRNLTIC